MVVGVVVVAVCVCERLVFVVRFGVVVARRERAS
jgi:hypothetical protein